MYRKLLRSVGIASIVALTATVALASPATANPTFGSITGTLTTSTGTPATGVRVTLLDTNHFHRGEVGLNSQGQFTFPQVRAGVYKVSFTNSAYQVQWAYQQRSFDTAAEITVTAGAATVVNDSLLAPGTITGRVTDSDGVPQAGIWASASGPDGSVGGSTDIDGRYTLSLLPGEYRVELLLGSGFSQWIPQQEQQHNAQVFTVSPGGTVVADDTVAPTGSIAGRVVDASGQPAANVYVSSRSITSGGGAVAWTDDNGDYQIPRLFPGNYKLRFQLPTGATQWGHGKLADDQADTFSVAVGNQTTVNETLLATGAIAGRFVDQDGAGIGNAEVTAYDNYNNSVYAMTDETGAYRFDDLIVGDYKVSFVDPTSGRRQYAYGVGNSEDAAIILVQANITTTVDDTLLTGGALRVTATDSVTGAPLTKFCALLDGPSYGHECTTNSEILFDGIGAGRYFVYLQPDESSLYMHNDAQATVTANATTDVAVPVQLGGAITATVNARATGAPVAGVCVAIVAAGTARLPDGEPYCSDGTGQLDIKPLPPGDYHMFVRPRQSTGFGAQWVGANGGTGAASSAKRITVTAGATTAAPAVLLDPAGAITGVVRGADNTPLADVGVALSSIHPGVGGDFPYTDQNGRYTVTGLGPYAWPLFFMDEEHARQWSGGTANRMVAKKIQVTSGATATYDIKLKTGTVITGSIRDRAGQPVPDAYLLAHSALTQDIIGIKWESGDTYEMRVLAPELVKVRAIAYVDDQQVDFWYDNGTDFASARTIAVPAQGRTLDLVVPIN
ncbi:MSCRAMM family protein [Polymorphospora rubra]|uniref:MSCRAMM family protein n=1 Tax=Polymorphospora rubra TaxID=338584 RepID=UPI001BB3BDE8|nr:carboxypeptidase-like regulatory domain-containing protein [Polymorphospora rubra]